MNRLLVLGMAILFIMLVSVGCDSNGSNGGGGTPTPPAQSGTISVTSSLTGASFAITGPATYSGTAPWSTTGAPAGTYSISWGDLSLYTAPSPQTKSLSSGGSISFAGNYVQNPVVVNSISDRIINGGSGVFFGGYVEAGHTLKLSWSADGWLECFILTENQYNNAKNSITGILSAWMAKGSGSSGTISANIQNGDTYYALVRNTYSYASPVKLYQAELKR